jgi:fatty acyl-CoA reductase
MSKPNELSIPQFYNNKSVFVTGGMGFLGKVIVEKLLRSCPGIEHIYLLARSKKGKSVSDRLDELINTPPFAGLRENNPKVFEKIVLIEGDVSEEKLGISEADQQRLCENVSIFIHSAATISFNEPLKIAVRTNLQSVGEILDLAKRARHLDVSFLRLISVAACHFCVNCAGTGPRVNGLHQLVPVNRWQGHGRRAALSE